MGEEQKSNLSQEASNNSFYTSASALQIRLNVEPVLTQLELDIRGLREMWDDETQALKVVRVSEPLFITKKSSGDYSANDKGIHMYLAFIRSVINTQVVQGNLKEDDYEITLYRIRRRIATDLMINRINWGLEIHNYNYVIDLAMNLMENFMTRLIGNKERESYANTFKTVESSNTVANSKGWFRV